MRQEKISFSIIVRIALSLIPVLLGMPTIAVVLCAYNIAMTTVLIGPVTTLISSLCAVCFSMFFGRFIMQGGELQGLYIALEAVLMGLGAGIIIVKRENFYKGVWLSSAAYLIVSYANIMQLSHNVGMSVADYLIGSSFQMASAQISQIFAEMKLDEVAIQKILEVVKNASITVIPSVLIITSVVVGYAVIWFVKNTLNKLPLKEKVDHSFSTMRIPRFTVIIMVVSLVLCFVIKEKNAGFVFINVFTVLAALSFFAGMSVVEFYLRKKVKSFPARLCMHIAIYFVSAFIAGFVPFANIFVIYILIGAADSFINIRRIKKSATEKEEVHEEERQA